MNGELSHGLPALITSGNRILRVDQMRPVLLRGVNRSGLEYSEPNAAGFLSAARITQDEIREIILGWRSNILRVPFNQDWCLNGRNGHSAEEYLASLDQVIAWASELNAYTILDLQWLDRDTAYGTTSDPVNGKNVNHVPPTPNEQTIALWCILAERYRDEPAVLFDLLNEPHNALEDDPNPLHLVGPNGMIVASGKKRFTAREWSGWATLLTTVIEKIRPDGLILVGGVDWAFDLRSVQVDAPNIVYSTHIYDNRSRKDWHKALARYEDVPIFVGEWGGTEQNVEFGEEFASVLRNFQLGWTAWSWADFPHLVARTQTASFEPTPFGSLVRNELRT